MPRAPYLLVLLAGLWLGSAQAGVREITAEEYGFPLANPFEATIAGTFLGTGPDEPDCTRCHSRAGHAL